MVSMEYGGRFEFGQNSGNSRTTGEQGKAQAHEEEDASTLFILLGHETYGVPTSLGFWCLS